MLSIIELMRLSKEHKLPLQVITVDGTKTSGYVVDGVIHRRDGSWIISDVLQLRPYRVRKSPDGNSFTTIDQYIMMDKVISIQIDSHDGELVEELWRPVLEARNYLGGSVDDLPDSIGE